MNYSKEVPKYAIHNETQIKGFFGEYRWLSNFGVCPEGVWHEGLWFACSENAFQAQKVKPEFRADFQNMQPNVAKREWKNYPLVYTEEVWKVVKVDIMKAICFNKFYNNPSLLARLLDTGNKYLEETNDWRDVFWGCDPVFGGQNQLGKILMKIRTFWAT